MREILFMGKRTDNGEWAYGDLLNVGVDYDYAIRTYGGREHGQVNAVNEKTVGQYTGLRDCTRTEEYPEGKRIFDGHILESRASENSEDWKRWLCVYKDGSFCFERKFGKHKKKYEQNLLCEDEINLYGLVVIGNIYDNPELFEEGE